MSETEPDLPTHTSYGGNPGYGPPDITGPAVTPAAGRAGYVVALVAGIPVALLMGVLALGSLLDGSLPGAFVLGLGGSATTGIVFAVKDLQAGTRHRRTAALLLTLIPAGLLGLIVGLLVFVLAMLGFGNPN